LFPVDLEFCRGIGRGPARKFTEITFLTRAPEKWTDGETGVLTVVLDLGVQGRSVVFCTGSPNSGRSRVPRMLPTKAAASQSQPWRLAEAIPLK
jgi:hypothetical protein